ncbi:MAG: T9SS type A sorting domain-containing protein [Bacteroidota bacterium]
MKKRLLLLSFAAFATVLSVNAQRSNQKMLSADKDGQKEVYKSNFVSSVKPTVSNTRASYAITDTSKLVDYRQAYGSGPTFYVGTSGYSNTITKVLKPTAAVSPATGVNYPSFFQQFVGKTGVKLNGIGVVLRSLNTTSADIMLNVYTTQYASLGSVTKTITANGTTLSNQFFMFTAPITLPDTFIVEVTPMALKDSARVLTSGYHVGSVTCTGSISGTSLTVASWTSMIGGFKNGDTIKGANVLPNTIVTGQTGAMIYTVSVTQNVATGTALSASRLKYNDIDASWKETWNYPTTGTPSQVGAYYVWSTSTAGIESGYYFYPIFDYTWNNNPTIDNSCLGTNNTVNVTLANEAFVKNPLYNRAAFYLKHVGYNAARDDMYYSRIDFSQTPADSVKVDHSSTLYGTSHTYSPATKDTITVNSVLWTYGIGANPNELIFDETIFPIGINPTATAGGNTTIATTGTATVSGATATNGTIAWTENGAGTITAGASTLTPTYTAAAGDAGNVVTLTMTVTGTAPCATQVTATYTVNVTGTVSVDANSAAKLEVYPNPANNVLNIANITANANVTMMNSLGQVVYSAVASDNLTVNTQNLTEGIYFVRVNNQVVKVIITK